MLAVLLAAALAGPPAPAEPDMLAHFDVGRDEGSGAALHLTLQAAAAGFDLWTTHRCLQAGTCREANPLASPDRVPYGLKAATFAVPAALAVWADATGRKRLAWWITGLAVAVQVGFGVNNLIVGSR